MLVVIRGLLELATSLEKTLFQLKSNMLNHNLEKRSVLKTNKGKRFQTQMLDQAEDLLEPLN